MSYEELYIEEKSFRNPVNGRFRKGHVPYTKGKKWSDFMSKRGQKRAKKGWKNLEIGRCNGGGPNSGRPKKPVIAVTDEGKFMYFSYVDAAARWCNGSRHNVARCCRQNHLGTLDRKGVVNTDHKYLGIRFYFESDNVWLQKIKK